MTERRIGVVGAGTIGVGVAHRLALAGHHPVVVEVDRVAVAGARARLRHSVRLTGLLRPTVPAAELAQVPDRITWTDRPADLAGVGLVVECVPERIKLKREVFARLDEVCPDDAVLASCTSAIPVAVLAAGVRRPDRVLGLHFMNPVPLKDAVEVVRGADTSDHALGVARDLLTGLGMEAVVVGDGPGFVLNRVLMLCIGEAAATVEAGTADARTVDTAFEKCLGHAMGPLRTADLIGLDNVVDTMVVLCEQTGDDRYRPPAVLTRLVDAGHYGRKTGRGFHDYA